MFTKNKVLGLSSCAKGNKGSMVYLQGKENTFLSEEVG